MKLEQLKQEYYARVAESKEHRDKLEAAFKKTSPPSFKPADNLHYDSDASFKEEHKLYPIQLYSMNGKLPMIIDAVADSIALDCHTHMVPASDLDVSMLSRIAREAFDKVMMNHAAKMSYTKPATQNIRMEDQILQDVNKIVKKRLYQQQRKLI